MDKNIEKLTAYFKAGEKTEKKLGVEFEHFLVDGESLRSLSYFESTGQEALAKRLVKKGWQIDYEEEGHILNASKDGNTLSFEPGGQLEISIKPLEFIWEIEAEYLAVRREVETEMEVGQALVSMGYHPKTKIEELPLLPKKRYGWMYEALHQKGKRARNMMKGSASTQVSIDYSSETDFIKKYRVANFLSPFLSTLFDAAPVFEGEIFEGRNLRVHIWDYTDPERCKIPAGVFEKTFDYNAYATYIMNTKPIFMPEGERTKFTESLTVESYAKGKSLSEKQLIHATTMVFPDVRLKQFIEIRMADALPLELSLMLPALVKGIFYEAHNLNRYYELSLRSSDDDMKRLNQMIQEYDVFDLTFLGDDINSRQFIEMIIEDAKKGLTEAEQQLLSRGHKWMLENRSYAEFLKRRAVQSEASFRDAIIENKIFEGGMNV